MPVGLGIGATQVGHCTISPWRAAGLPLIITVPEPMATKPGPAGTHVFKLHGSVCDVTVAAGRLLMMTFGDVFRRILKGCGGCAAGVGVGAGG